MRLMICVWFLAACSTLAATEEQISKSLTAAPGGSLVVEVDFGAIELATNANGKVALDIWRKITRKTKAEEEEFLKKCPVLIEQEGDTITIKCRRKDRNSGWSGMSSRNEARYKLSVPAQFNARLTTAGGAIAVSDVIGEVRAHTSGGGLRFVRVQGALTGGTSGGGIHVSECKGAVKINTSGGGIEVSGGGGSLDGNTSGGGVTVKRFSGPIDVGTSGGGITVEEASDRVKATSSGGSVNASLLGPVKGEIWLSTSGGGVTLRVPPDAAFNLAADCSGGSVQCDLPIVVQGKKEVQRLHGPVNGGGPKVQLSTSGGGVRVKAR